MKYIYDKVDLTLSPEEFYRVTGRKKTVGMYTLGCKVNQYETEAITSIFRKAEYEVVDFEEKADVYVINTCTVTNLSDRKSRQMIRKAKKTNKDSIVVVVGCYAQTAPDEVAAIEGVNLIIGTKDRGQILDYIEQIVLGEEQINVVNDIMGNRFFEELSIDSNIERTRAFLKIQEGCSQFCAYCIIPYARGPIRSRKPDEVISEAKKMVEAGFKELVLTGIHVASYGKDLKEEKTSLLEIIKEVHSIQGLERLRLGSIEPTTITEEFAKMAGELDKLCPHYHISLQSGCDTTLKRMNRKYNTNEYEEGLIRLRRHVLDVAITTDVMVGFPGETKEEFEQTVEYLKKINLYQMHIFKYSPRKGTPAATFNDQVKPETKEERSKILIDMSLNNTISFNKSHIGKEITVLLEQFVKGKDGYMEGMTPNYIKVICKVDRDRTGEIVKVLLEDVVEDYMVGSIV